MNGSERLSIARGWSADLGSPHIVRLRAPGLSASMRFLFLSDTHLGWDDDRDAEYRENSRRMAEAFVTTRRHATGEVTSPRALFVETLERAREVAADLVVIGGDLLSFPSLAAAEWAKARLDEAGVPWVYVAGNHDWHFEGMAGSSAELRSWGTRRLAPLYRGRDPLMGVHDAGGVRFVLIDNATYEVTDEQLAFYRDAIGTDGPVILACHVPMYVPGRGVGYGCGHPAWGAATDRNFQIERRNRWPEAGHTETTMRFHRELFSTKNLLAVFSGHTHRAAVDTYAGIPQFVAPANAFGGCLDVTVEPAN